MRTADFTFLSDGDAAATSDLVTRRRARTMVPDVDATYRANLVTAYVAATYWTQRLALLAEAVRYDRRHPTEPSLADELYGTDHEAVA